MPSLSQLLSDPSALPIQMTLYAKRPWTGTAEAVVDEPDDVPPGYEYLLEVELAVEVLETWTSWREGRTPSPEEAVVAVIHYAEHDAYLPVTR